MECPGARSRAAIQEAGATPEIDVINFNIPAFGVPTINISTALPLIVPPIIIDGSTQAAGRVELTYIGAATNVDGLQIDAFNSTVKNLVINRFSGAGIRLTIYGGGGTITGNYIGIEANGEGCDGCHNYSDGHFLVASNNNVIGGMTPAARNVISGNWGSESAISNAVIMGYDPGQLHRHELGREASPETQSTGLSFGLAQPETRSVGRLRAPATSYPATATTA